MTPPRPDVERYNCDCLPAGPDGQPSDSPDAIYCERDVVLASDYDALLAYLRAVEGENERLTRLLTVNAEDYAALGQRNQELRAKLRAVEGERDRLFSANCNIEMRLALTLADRDRLEVNAIEEIVRLKNAQAPAPPDADACQACGSAFRHTHQGITIWPDRLPTPPDVAMPMCMAHVRVGVCTDWAEVAYCAGHDPNSQTQPDAAAVKELWLAVDALMGAMAGVPETHRTALAAWDALVALRAARDAP